MTAHPLARPVLAMTLAVVTAAWVVADANWGVARLVCLLAFLLVGPGLGALSLWFREIDDAASEAVIVVALSVSLDIAVAQGMVWIGAWYPSTAVLGIAGLTLLMGGIASVRLRGRREAVQPIDRASP
jgi:hypothetical protein